MGLKESFRVGLAVVLAAGVLVWVTFYVRKGAFSKDTYLQPVAFENAQGIQRGAYVRARGVDIGEVADVRLSDDGRAILDLALSRAIRLGPGTKVRIVGGMFSFSPPFVEITPSGVGELPAGIILTGESGPTTDRMVSEADLLVRNLNVMTSKLTGLTDSLTGLLEDKALRGAITRSAENLDKITESGVVIARNMEQTTAGAARLMKGFERTTGRFEGTLAKTDRLFSSLEGTAKESQGLMTDSRGLIGDLRSVVQQSGETVKGSKTLVEESNALVRDTRGALAENREKLSNLLSGLDSAARRLDATLAETQKLVGDAGLRDDLKATVGNLREATNQLKQISNDVRAITGDSGVQEDLRASITNLREATDQAQDVFKRVKGVIGSSGETARTISQRVSEAETRVSILRATDSSRTRLDLDATIPWTATNYYRLGFYDLGESDKLVIQAGQRTPRNTWTRFGLYAGTLGLGLDVGNRQRPALSLDVFGVDDPQVDARAFLRLAPFLDLGFGLDDLFRRSDPTVGLYYRK